MLALINAGIPVKDMVAACSVGYLNDIACIDLNANERKESTSLLIAKFAKSFHSHEKIEGNEKTPEPNILLMNTMNNAAFNKRRRLTLKQVREMTEAGKMGCDSICEVMASRVIEHTTIGFDN